MLWVSSFCTLKEYGTETQNTLPNWKPCLTRGLASQSPRFGAPCTKWWPTKELATKPRKCSGWLVARHPPYTQPTNRSTSLLPPVMQVNLNLGILNWLHQFVQVDRQLVSQLQPRPGSRGNNNWCHATLSRPCSSPPLPRPPASWPSQPQCDKVVNVGFKYQRR